jgi:hypothetical protein
MVPPPQPTRKRPISSKTLILSMKIPLKPGIGIDGLIPYWPEKLQGPKNCQNLRLLNSEDPSRRPSSIPDCAYQIEVGVHVLLLRLKSNTTPLLPFVTEGHGKAWNCGVKLRQELPESALRTRNQS